MRKWKNYLKNTFNKEVVFVKSSTIKVKKNMKDLHDSKDSSNERQKNIQFFHAATFPLGYFNEDFFEIAIRETMRGFLEEN